ncbi:hypothetical protein XNW1_3340001 [Xenorhabdus nematophila str. Websteri]|nr:hypothetical protein XNW1_3340001 [Xenorhabdus nematophila str. Websteri]
MEKAESDPETAGLSISLENLFNVQFLLKYVLGTLICREPDAVVPHVRF